jgi:hypothetical protein
MQEPQLKQVILYNGEPELRVTKMRAGHYEWATKKSGKMSHSLLSEVEAYMRQYGYKYYIEDQKPKVDDDED